MSTRRRRLDASWYLDSCTFVEAGLMPHFIITSADADKAAAGIPLADQPVSVPNMKRVTSVQQVFVCQRYKDNNYLGTSTSCAESTVCGLFADKDKNETRSFFTSSVDTSEYQIRSLRRNSKIDEYGDIRTELKKSSSALQVCSWTLHTV